MVLWLYFVFINNNQAYIQHLTANPVAAKCSLIHAFICCQKLQQLHGNWPLLFLLGFQVRSLEQKNQVLVTKWKLLQKQTVPTVRKDLKPLCENFLSKLRKKLDCLLCEKQKLENQQKTTHSMVEENRCK